MTIYNDQVAATIRQHNLTIEQVAAGCYVSVHTVRSWLRPRDSAGWRRVRPERIHLLLRWVHDNINTTEKTAKMNEKQRETIKEALTDCQGLTKLPGDIVFIPVDHGALRAAVKSGWVKKVGHRYVLTVRGYNEI